MYGRRRQMRGTLFTFVWLLSSCTPSEEKNEEGNKLSIATVDLVRDRYDAMCREQLTLRSGYSVLPISSFKHYMKFRYNGERLSAYLVPNSLYCAFIKQEESRKCIKVAPVDIGPGGSVDFCVNDDGEVVDLRADE